MKKAKKLVVNIILTFALLLGVGVTAETILAEVQLSVTAGSELYLPYIALSDEKVYYGTDDPSEDNPVVWFYDIEGSDLGWNIIYANRPGSVNIYAITEDGGYYTKVIDLDVFNRKAVFEERTWVEGYPVGHIGSSNDFKASTTGTYRFVMKGAHVSTIVITDAEDNVVGAAQSQYNGSEYVTTLDVMIEADKLYLVNWYTYTSIEPFDIPAYGISYEKSIGQVRATDLSINLAGQDVLNVGSDGTYYMLVGDLAKVEATFTGNMYWEDEYYECGSTNSGVVSCEKNADGSYHLRANAAGTAAISATSTSLLQDSMTIKVVNESEIIKGDVNLDGVLNEEDAINVYSVVNGDSPYYRIFDYADMNDDGNLNQEDVEIILNVTGALEDKRFVDVSKDDWFYDAVEFNFSEGLMTGLNPFRFGPYGTLSRAQFATILYRMEGTPEFETFKTFYDITGDEWYGPAILWAAENDVVTGYQDGNFGPADMITREQMVLILYRYAKYCGEDVTVESNLTGFNDADSVSGFAAKAMRWAIGEGIITGKENGTIIDPQGTTSRAEAAVLIQRYLAGSNQS